MKRVVLMSIRPRFAEAILAGRKTVELRRRGPKVKNGDLVAIYASSPQMSLVGMFEVGEVLEHTPESLWRRVGSRSCLERPAFMAYFDGRESGSALVVSRVRRASRDVNLSELRKALPGFVAPQSYRYLTNDELRALPGHWATMLSSPRAPVAVGARLK